ncbi:MAG: hypothetical protein J6S85_21825 [Methanobrevibacter sp.]|nr:hypothetical protein [Methanobrevibacter sp.]
MNLKNVAEIGGNGLQYLISVTQIEEWARVFGLILSIIISILILVDKVVTWFKRAKSDGKITSDEIKEGVDIIKDGVEDIKEHIEKNK